MRDSSVQIFFPRSASEAQQLLNENPSARVTAGGSDFALDPAGDGVSGPVICVANIPEISAINKSDRYLEIGAAATLNSILALGERNIPSALYEAIQTVATYPARNIAAIGGCLGSPSYKKTIFAPLAALDAKVEARLALHKPMWTSLNKYFSLAGSSPRGKFISRLRVPLDNWDFSLFKRVGRLRGLDADSGSFTALINAQKSVISDVRIAYAGAQYFRITDLENMLAGHALPLPRREIHFMLGKTTAYLDSISFPENMARRQILNFIQFSLTRFC